MRIVRSDEQGPGQPGLLNAEGQTFAPGDLIVTGTPASVAMEVAPPEFLKPGDLVQMSITGFGAQRHTVIVS
jgi:2-keto-4-pentenoate hydratase/2-oxohepta-3-ene-1,7-dioic acid hydratase in catechol pathway